MSRHEIDGCIIEGEIWVNCAQVTASLRQLASDAKRECAATSEDVENLDTEGVITVAVNHALSVAFDNVADSLDFAAIAMAESKE